MHAKTLLFTAAAAAMLAGCSGGESVPDYHTVIPTAKTGPTQQALSNARMKCNEANSIAAAAANPWCGVVDKVKRCLGEIETHEEGYTAEGTIWTSPERVAQVKANPTVACPPK